MIPPNSKHAAHLAAVVAALALFASACGGSSTPVDPAIIATADANAAELVHSDDFAGTQLLDAFTGEISSVSDVATGDRAVLVWYWAPH